MLKSGRHSSYIWGNERYGIRLDWDQRHRLFQDIKIHRTWVNRGQNLVAWTDLGEVTVEDSTQLSLKTPLLIKMHLIGDCLLHASGKMRVCSCQHQEWLLVCL